LRSVLMAPVSSLHIAQPDVMVIQWHCRRGRSKNDCTGYKILRKCSREFPRVGFAFGNGHVTGSFDKARELVVCHLRLVHPETINCDAMKRTRITHRWIF